MLLFNCIITVFCSITLMEITPANSKFQNYTKSTETGIRLEPMKPRLTGYSIIMCGYECEKTENCVSFSYHATMELCEINRYNPNDELATRYNSSGWEIFIKYEEKCWPTDGYEGFVREGMCYFWTSWAPYNLSWANATDDCQDKGADLVCIDTEAEKQALVGHKPKSYLWTGLNDLDGDGVYTCNGRVPLFIKWASGRPFGDSCRCTWFSTSSGNWYDECCFWIEEDYVCEKQLYQ